MKTTFAKLLTSLTLVGSLFLVGCNNDKPEAQEPTEKIPATEVPQEEVKPEVEEKDTKKSSADTKKFLKEYEQFVADYCEFGKKMKNADMSEKQKLAEDFSKKAENLAIYENSSEEIFKALSKTDQKKMEELGAKLETCVEDMMAGYDLN